ncbi:ParB/RepB/Spo0J family partition protein [Nonomuraea zeae]|uniref:ParB/RepB/Spo0J family partition protein n=1 Tax=Nonomuraea zeae TaxID=1642303 RepID=UPI00147928A8|nr:ParB/RepB/Spo0J family partition protein [Nonomuraea zeae]
MERSTSESADRESGFIADDVVLVRLDELTAADSPRRQGVDLDHARALAEVEGPLPPIFVHFATMRVIDGMHRLTAARLAGRTDIEVRFFHGTSDEAFRVGVQANVSHGLPLSLADRKSAAARIIWSHPYLSDRAIALSAGLAAATVATLRTQTDGSGEVQARTGADGRVRPLNAAKGRLVASEVIAERPDATLREIAQVAGISIATAQDVRRRVLAGVDPVPDRLKFAEEDVSQRRPLPSGAGVTTDRIDVTRMIDTLRRDPSLRYSDSGRLLLRWLDSRTVTVTQWAEVAENVPPHCLTSIAKVARECARTWSDIAEMINAR